MSSGEADLRNITKWESVLPWDECKSDGEDKLMNLNFQIAKVCHNVNKIYCESIGDGSQLDWEDAPQWQKDSAVNGVIYLLNNDVTPRQIHSNWVSDKIQDGWVYGDVKDADKKTHPCIVPYEQLSKEQHAKDYLFKAIVDSYK